VAAVWFALHEHTDSAILLGLTPLSTRRSHRNDNREKRKRDETPAEPMHR
jgi:hypothetical protein